MSNGLESRMDRVEATLDRVAALTEQNSQQLSRLDARVDEFVFQAQRLISQQAERLNVSEARLERMESIAASLTRNEEANRARLNRLDETIERLDRNYEIAQSNFAEFQRTTNAALERIDRVLDYLMRQQGGGA